MALQVLLCNCETLEQSFLLMFEQVLERKKERLN